MILSFLLNLQSVQWLSDYELWRCIQTRRSPDMIKLAPSLFQQSKFPHIPSLRSSPSLSPPPPPTPSPSQRSHLHYSSSPATPPHHPPLTLFFFIHSHDMFWVNSSPTTSVSPIRDRSVMGEPWSSCLPLLFVSWGGLEGVQLG